jgi:hypothetical protein
MSIICGIFRISCVLKLDVSIFFDFLVIRMSIFTAMTPVSGGDSWTVVTDKDDHVGVGKVTVLDDSRLVFEYVRTITDGGEVFDSFTLQRDHSVYGPQGRRSVQ